jgi:hypothetical protein
MWTFSASPVFVTQHRPFPTPFTDSKRSAIATSATDGQGLCSLLGSLLSTSDLYTRLLTLGAGKAGSGRCSEERDISHDI